MQQFTEEQILIQNTAKQFAEDRLLPNAGSRDLAGKIEPEIIEEMGALGFLGMMVPEDLGGVGANAVSYTLALMEIARGDGSVSTVMSVHNSPFCAILERFASTEQKQEWLMPAAQGQFIGCFALTEPSTGSDAASIKTRAIGTGDGYLLTGAKQFITSGAIGGATIVFAVTDPSAAKKGVSAFYLKQGSPGFLVGEPERKLGQKASDTCALTFDGCHVPKNALIGDEGQGLAIALSSLESGRIGIAAQSVGMAQSALDFAAAYASERQTFGKPIINHQAVAFRLAEMDAQIESARQMVLHAARLKDNKAPCLREASIAKLVASEMVEKVSSQGLQILGGYGFLADYPLERIYRDQRVCQIYEGTSDVQKINISRDIKRRYAK